MRIFTSKSVECLTSEFLNKLTIFPGFFFKLPHWVIVVRQKTRMQENFWKGLISLVFSMQAFSTDKLLGNLSKGGSISVEQLQETGNHKKIPTFDFYCLSIHPLESKLMLLPNKYMQRYLKLSIKHLSGILGLAQKYLSYCLLQVLGVLICISFNFVPNVYLQLNFSFVGNKMRRLGNAISIKIVLVFF